MNKPKHTPGPWCVVDNPSRALEVRMPEPYQDTPVCSMRWTDGLNRRVEAAKLADANLIAASPAMYGLISEFGDRIADMFEQMLRGHWVDDHGHDVQTNQCMAALPKLIDDAIKLRAAIAKAETPA